MQPTKLAQNGKYLAEYFPSNIQRKPCKKFTYHKQFQKVRDSCELTLTPKKKKKKKKN